MSASVKRMEHAAVLAGALGLVGVLAISVLAPDSPPSKGPAPPPFLPVLAMLGCGVLLITGSFRPVVSGLRARRWPRATGTISETRSLGGLYVYVRCRYVAAGAEHEIEQVRLGRAREGAPVSVRYHPTNPSRAALAPTVHWGVAAALAVGVAVVGVGASLLALG